MKRLNLPSNEEREMLRDSLRGFLTEHWPALHSVEWSGDSKTLAGIWSKLAAQGVAALGTNPEEGYGREISVVMEELGRAACPAPMLGAALANLALSGKQNRYQIIDSLLGQIHDGVSRISFAFGSYDHDDTTGAVTASDGALTGKLRCVEGASSATHLLVAVATDAGPELAGIAIVDCSQPGIDVVETIAMGSHGMGEITLSGVSATIVDVASKEIEDLNLLARIFRLARAHGAARRAFEMVVEYAKERRQFGRAIGSFQAVQHKLANCLINLEGIRLTQWNAAASYDQGVEEWRYFASTAFAFASKALRQVALETHHAFGAIGYAEEHEAPRHFRRVHVDMVSHGGLHRARDEVAKHFFDGAMRPLPTYDLGEAGNAFRETVRVWLEENWSGERKAAFDCLTYEHREYDPSFAKDIGKTGWIGMSWPIKHGGQERTPMEQLAFMEEMERAEAPRVGASVQANALMMFGTQEQQAKYLPEMLQGEAMHGMGYSEPNAGSDLASLRTTAVREGDQWLINGQKIWTTTWWGKYMFLAARTDPEAKPSHAGISMFVVPMDAPGITINPAKTMYDGSFANIFYDNVRLPADALVGEVNGGWKVLTGALAYERGLIGGGIVLKVAHSFELLCDYIKAAKRGGKPLGADPIVRDRIATLAAEIEVGRQLMVHCAELAVDGVTPPHYGAISKVFSGELMERFGETALDIIGAQAALSEGMAGAIANGKFEQGLRHSLMWVISIGTNEIQRTLIAQRGLGLPK
jgi:alkylation response protein AidB-like acyl-CoA dehydrogenase